MLKWTVGFENWKYFVLKIKDQLISKGLFGAFNSSEKRTKTSRPEVEFYRSFFGRIQGTNKSFRN